MTTEATANIEESWPPPSPSAGFLRKLVKPLVTTALYAIIFYKFVDERALLSRLASTELGYVAAGVLIYVAGQLLSTWKWHLLLKPVRLTVSYGQLAGFYFIGMFFNHFFPTIVGGDAVKAVLLARATGAPARSAISVFMERNVGLLALFSIAGIAVLRAPEVVLLGVPLHIWTAVLFAGFVAANMVLTSVRAYHLVDRLIAFVPMGGLRPRASTLYQAIEPYKRSVAPLAAGFLLSLIFQAIVIVVVFLNVRALGLGHLVPLQTLAVIVPLVSLAGMIPSINGLGVRDTLYIVLLGQLGVLPEAALSLSILYFAVTVLASLPGGVVYALRRPSLPGNPPVNLERPQLRRP